jgi:hypothetical protein
MLWKEGDVHSLPPLPIPVYSEMRAEAACGCSLVIGIIIVLVGSTHASLAITVPGKGPSDLARMVGLTLIWGEAVVALLCLLGLMWGDPGATAAPNCGPGATPHTQASAPHVRRRRQAHARDLLPASGRGRGEAPQRPLARRDGEHHRGRPRLLHPLPGLAARGRRPARLLPVLRRRGRHERGDAPLRHMPTLRHQLRPPLRRLRPLHRGDVALGEHALLQRHHPDGRRRLHHLHRVLLHGCSRLRAAARAPPEDGQGRLSLRTRS